MRITYLVIVTVDEDAYDADEYGSDPVQTFADEIQSNLESLESSYGTDDAHAVQVINIAVDKDGRV